ncbi:MAG: hypothetical protein DRQ89_11890 [Epsilonproteobacteria bacterium]|nr:MAG: hypothetical protein DRQ89_11890 [Campylobacterota bacterium]
MNYTSIFRILGKKKNLFESRTTTKLEIGDYIVYKTKTYKIVHRQYHFGEGEDHIHYNVAYIPRGTGLWRVFNEFIINILVLIRKI